METNVIVLINKLHRRKVYHVDKFTMRVAFLLASLLSSPFHWMFYFHHLNQLVVSGVSVGGQVGLTTTTLVTIFHAIYLVFNSNVSIYYVGNNCLSFYVYYLLDHL